jgi:hypothetical protein
MSLPKLPPVPPPSQAAVAEMIAGLIRQGHSAQTLVTLMRWDKEGKALLLAIAATETAEELLAPFRADPASWQALSPLGEPALFSFATDLISEAKAVVR